MSKIYIFGHKNPDTDSVTSAISLSYLKNKLGYNTTPRVLGDISLETKYVLETFKMPKPKYLDNVFLQMKDVDYKKDFVIHKNKSQYETYKVLEEEGSSGIPVVADNNDFVGIVTLKKLLKNIVATDTDYINTSYDNIITSLGGNNVTKFDEEISGKLVVASYRSTTFLNYVDLTDEHILIVGNRHSIIEHAIRNKVKLIIVIGEYRLKEEHIELAKKNKVNIIVSGLDSINTIKIIGLSNYLKDISETKEDTVYFYENDYYKDFLTVTKRYKHNNYPILNKNDQCVGLIRVAETINRTKKKVILVDHNDKEQSVEGLEEAEIVEIVDHHNIGALSTNTPINIRSMTVGSTNTIIYSMYDDYQIEIPKSIAGLMLSGILSDTLILTSPTTTPLDSLAAHKLAEIAEVDLRDYGMKMLKAGTKIGNKSVEDVLTSDFKSYTVEDKKLGVSQILTFDVNEVINNLDKYKVEMNNISKYNHLDSMLLAITDVMEGGSYFVYTEDLEEVIKRAYKLNEINQGIFVERVVSRKQQIVPPILDNL